MQVQHAFFLSCCCFACLSSTLNFQKLPSYMHVLWGNIVRVFVPIFSSVTSVITFFLLLAVIRRTVVVITAVFCRRYSCT